MSEREIVAVDLFCGGGGFSEGLRRACDRLGYSLRQAVGAKSERTEQIGNAVPVNLARELCLHLLTAEDPSLATYGGGLSGDPDADIPDYEEVASND